MTTGAVRIHCALFILAVAGTNAMAQTSALLRDDCRAVLAQLDGEIALPGLTQPVEVLRDRWGVPHIYAKNQHDLFFAQGFVAAQDRLFQMDVWRRLAAGETAEVLGESGIPIDRFARLVRYRGDMQAEWQSYSPDTREIAEAFSDGVNAYIDRAGDRLPIEFKILGVRPSRWRPEDTLGRMAAVAMTRNLKNEVQRAQLVAAVGAEKAAQLVPPDPPHEPVVALDHEELAAMGKHVIADLEAATSAWKFSAGGSNNWVVDGTRSASGKPLLASDPHREIALPALRYLVHLNAPGWNVIGAGEPALPGVAIGHNERIAWGFTVVTTDQNDLVVEETHPADPTRYKAGDQWQPMQVVREKVRVKGKDAAIEIELRFTRNGPVIYQDEKRRRAYALRWVGSEPGTAAYLPSLAIDRAGNWQEFRAAVARWKTPSENIIYADVEGNIGWIAAALTPKRRGSDGLLPVPGASGKFAWDGFLSIDDYPQEHNPNSHTIATANHNILPAGYEHEISYEWAPPYRIGQVRRRLEEKPKFTLSDFAAYQHDNTSIPGQTLARIAGRMKNLDSSLEPFRGQMAEWDGVLHGESAAGAVYGLWLQRIMDEFFRPRVPAELMEFVTGPGRIPLVLEQLERPTETWFGTKTENSGPEKSRDEFLARTLAQAVQKGKELLGDPAKTPWTWGRLHTVRFKHPLSDLGESYAKAFSLGPIALGGDGLCPNAARHNEKFEVTNGPSYRQLFDLADWDKGLATSTPGQSGQPGSPHYADLLPLWSRGEYFPLAFSRKKVEEVTAHKLVLRPKE
ncbi:MAG: penicillin acylase family protein [Planctomycetia bacterium]|nr:penicillin acylase family protein [Planctomycetia bacterium]